MWCDSELHYSMLEKACEDGDTTMAECLIELGADINKKTKTESLIYQVRGHKTVKKQKQIQCPISPTNRQMNQVIGSVSVMASVLSFSGV